MREPRKSRRYPYRHTGHNAYKSERRLRHYHSMIGLKREPQRPSRPTHLILCPTRESDGSDAVESNVDELYWHAKRLKPRIDTKKTRHAAILRIDHKQPKKLFSRAAVLYVIGHCNGSSFGSKNSGIIDFTAKTLADWLIATGLLKHAKWVKIMACYTASVIKPGHIPFAKQVSQHLKAAGQTDIFVRGYDGSVRETTIDGRLVSMCKQSLWQHNSDERAIDNATDPSNAAVAKEFRQVRASEAATDFYI